MILTDPHRRRATGNGLIEPAAHRRTIDDHDDQWLLLKNAGFSKQFIKARAKFRRRIKCGDKGVILLGVQ